MNPVLLPLITVRLLSLAVLLALPVAGLAKDLDLDEPAEEKKPAAAGVTATGGADDIDAAIADQQKFQFCLAPVAEPARKLGPNFYWRTVPGAIAAETFPVRFKLDGQDAVEGADAIGPVPLNRLAKDITLEYTYPTENTAPIANGQHKLFPGGIPLRLEDSQLTSAHAAITVKAGEVRILCAPVRFDGVTADGTAIPTPVKVSFNGVSLLRAEGSFNPLVIWLPVGTNYQSSFGNFAIAADGKITATGDVATGVIATPDGFRRTVPQAAPATAPPPADDERTNLLKVVLERRSSVGENAYQVYATPRQTPGAPILMALLPKQYEAATDHPFAQDNFAAAVSALLAAPAPDAALAALAAKALGGTPATLAWLAVAPSPDLRGAVNIYIRDKFSPGWLYRGVVAHPGAELFIVPARWRTVFNPNETAVFQLLLAGGFGGGEAEITLAPAVAGANPLSLGRLALPRNPDRNWDSRLFTINFQVLPEGDYDLVVTCGAQRSPPQRLTVVSWYERSPFFLHSMSGCTEAWPTDAAGLKILHEAGLEMVTATGFHSMLDVGMPRIATNLQPRVTGLPAEALLAPAPNDLLLERLMRAQLRMTDLTVLRADSFYLESLSYHHSFKPSVDRTLRRFQVFTQQTADYPSFWGINHSWFPSQFGYAEGGVPCDGHIADRNRVLQENVAKAGFKDPSKEEKAFYQANKFSDDPAARAKALKIMQTAAAYWLAQYDFGFGKHNKLYNDAAREVRPDLATSLFENAGHDIMKPTRSLFNDMSASCYESYTDYGEWPMSTSFTTDWAKGNFPGKPVWLTTDWGTSTEGKIKSLLHGFVRGLDGGGVPMQESCGELERRGMGLRLLQHYGALHAHARPDCQVALLSTDAEQVFTERAQYLYHAAYYHLTRLGFPPIVLADYALPKTGVPAGVKVMCIVRLQQPFEPAVEKILAEFAARGGRLLMLGECEVKLPGAVVVNKPLRHIWQMSGFDQKAHMEMWEEFETVWREPLAAGLKQCGLTPLAGTDPDRALALAMDAGPVRYVAVIADAKGTPSSAFHPTEGIPVSLAGEGWLVRDLVHQKDLVTTTANGATAATVDLVTEPCTLLACYKAAPSAVTIKAAAPGVKAGGEIIFTAAVKAKGGEVDLGAVPVRFTVTDPAGHMRHEVFYGAGDPVAYRIAGLDATGTWKLQAQELLTGVQATLNIAVEPAAAAVTPAAAVPEVHIAEARHLQDFVRRKDEFLVILEAGQEKYLPVATRLVAAMTASGVKARLWQPAGADYDTIPIRWIPHPEDTARFKLVDAGKLIGYRGNLAPYIDKKERRHIPEFGGYPEIDPPWLVGRDCVVFAGGRLAESLRAVTPWMQTPAVPGRGQGRLVVCFSPFAAGKAVTAIVANDQPGIEKAADALAAQFAKREAPLAAAATSPEPPPPTAPARYGAEATQSVAAPVPTPFVNYTPIRRVRQLLATADGNATVLLNGKTDCLAFVDPNGKLTAAVTVTGKTTGFCQTDNQGRFWDFPVREPDTNAAGYAAELKTTYLRGINRDGSTFLELPCFYGVPVDPPEDYLTGFAVAPDGASAAFGRPAGLRLGPLATPATWPTYDDLRHVRDPCEVRHPRLPVGVTFSPDGKYLVMTMDTRPRMGGMGVPQPAPSNCETVLLETATARRVWALRDEEGRSLYAISGGTAAVAANGEMTALQDYYGLAFLVDKTGKILQRVDPFGRVDFGRQSSRIGTGAWIAGDGKVALFAYPGFLLVLRPDGSLRIPQPGIASAAFSPDGSLIAVGTEAGEVKAFSPDGRLLWRAASGGVAPQVAIIAGRQVLAANSNADLITYDATGKETRRISLAVTAAQAAQPLKETPQFQRLTSAPEYQPPQTLATAKQLLGAEQVAHWQAEGTGNKAFGLDFRTLAADTALAAPADCREAFVRLVYRRPAANKALTVLTVGKDGTETFLLDLSTPEYREIDIPVRGPGIKITLKTDGPVDLAEFSLWSIKWPGPNKAYVRDVNSGPADGGEGAEDDGMKDLDGDKSAAPGAAKECKIYIFNTDPDQVQGRFMKPEMQPFEVVNGRRFGNGKLPLWRFQKCPGYRGGWFTEDFAAPTDFGLVATYDRAGKQSETARNLAVFHQTAFVEGAAVYTVLAGVVGSDQFWNLFALQPPAKTRILGVKAFLSDDKPCGLSEIEAYK